MAQALILALVVGTAAAGASWWVVLIEALVCSILCFPSFHLNQFLGIENSFCVFSSPSLRHPHVLAAIFWSPTLFLFNLLRACVFPVYRVAANEHEVVGVRVDEPETSGVDRCVGLVVEAAHGVQVEVGHPAPEDVGLELTRTPTSTRHGSRRQCKAASHHCWTS